MTTKELRKSAEAWQKQISLLELQTFGNTFFQLLRQHNEIVNDISIRVANGTHDGRDCFSFFVMEFNGTVKQIAANNPGTTSLEVIEKACSEFSENYLSEFGHYFRNLYNIIRFVDESGIDERRDGINDDAVASESSVKERKRYTNLIRAQLSSYELILLYYNCLWSGGCGRFKRFAGRYELLDNLELPRIAFPKTDAEKMKLFGPTAFGPQAGGECAGTEPATCMST